MPPQGTQSSRAWTFTVFALEEGIKSWIAYINGMNLSKHFVYICVGGPELSKSNTYHVHAYVEFKSQKTENAVRKSLNLGGYKVYFTRQNKCSREELVAHHCKLRSKVDPNVLCLLEYPTQYKVPVDDVQPLKSSPVKANMSRLRELIEARDLETIKNEMYGQYLQKRTNILAEINAIQTTVDKRELEHYWIYGKPGTGKTTSVEMLFPDAFTMDPDSGYFDGYSGQKQIIIPDIDNRMLRKIGLQKLKTMCDSTGFNANVKYAGGQKIKAQIIVTSNHSIDDCLKYSGRDAKYNSEWFDEVDRDAIHRRFNELSVDKWLFQNNIRLKSPGQLKQLKKAGCCDLKQLFEPFDLERKVSFEETLQQEFDTAIEQATLHANNAIQINNQYDMTGTKLDIDFKICRKRSYPFKDETGTGLIWLGSLGEKRLKIKQYKPVGKNGDGRISVRETDSDMDESHCSDTDVEDN